VPLIRVAIAEDHPEMRTALRLLLKLSNEMELIWEGSNGQEAVECVQLLQPDVLVMDIRMPVLDGWRATRQILDLGLGTAVVLISSYSGREIARISEEVGAKGFVPKDNLAASLLTAIKAVYRGGTFFGE